jgi:hypothetical protein
VKKSLLVIALITAVIFMSCDKSPTSPQNIVDGGQQSIIVTFPDANFEALITETLNKPTGDITNIDLSTIT